MNIYLMSPGAYNVNLPPAVSCDDLKVAMTLSRWFQEILLKYAKIYSINMHVSQTRPNNKKQSTKCSKALQTYFGTVYDRLKR